MKKKYILLGLFLLFIIQLFLYQDSLSSKRELEAGQEAYEALAESSSEALEDVIALPGTEENHETPIEPFPIIINKEMPIPNKEPSCKNAMSMPNILTTMAIK